LWFNPARMNVFRMPIAASRRLLVTSLLVLPCLAAAVVAGCGDDDDAAPVSTPDSGVDGKASDANNVTPTPDTGAPSSDAGDAGVDAAALQALQKRGQYLVEAVVGCSDCHTPRNADGSPNMAKFLSGVDCFVDVDGPTDGGCLSSRNLTNHATGLANRSDAEIKDMFMNGKRPNGEFLNNFMPYYTLHNLKAEDADAIVAFLRTVPGVEHTVRPNDPPFANPPAASNPINPADIPNASDAGLEAGADLENGKYLAQFACMECHTKHTAPGTADPLVMSKVFGGDQAFPAKAIGLPVPPFPETIYSANITHDVTGLAGWTVGDQLRVVQHGKDRNDGGVCPPMPTGPNGAFGKLTDKDALDIESYIHGVPNVTSTPDGGSGSCVAP
jgi:mono/diheme cytochrome c family protein